MEEEIHTEIAALKAFLTAVKQMEEFTHIEGKRVV